MAKQVRPPIAVKVDVQPETAPETAVTAVDENSEFVRTLRWNLRAQGVTGAAQEAEVRARWAERVNTKASQA